MAEDLLALAADLGRRGEAFALATVVRCERPTSAKPGAKALVRADGSIFGWVGGACAEPVVVREALRALRDGQPRFIGLVGEGKGAPGRTEGIFEYPMTCHSGGTLEIYVEPYLPKPLLLLIGHGPVVEALAALGRTAGYTIRVLPADALAEGLASTDLNPRTSVVVATHGELDDEVLARVLAQPVGYVSLVASRKRAAVIVESLRRRGIAPERLGRLKAPAGLDIGAVTPDEIAVSVLAEIIQHQRSEKPFAVIAGTHEQPAAAAEATDPICKMVVNVATARYQTTVSGQTVYFCCLGCKERFDSDPARYLAALER
jgi:xanthine dehydrogenase accessory factor